MNDLPSIAIAVLERGFVYVGRPRISDGFLTLSEPYNIRRWGTTRGLGQLATEGPQSETKMDANPDVLVPMHALIHLIACKPEKWPQYAS